MPEGHSIHRLARDHAAWFVGHTIGARSPQGRFDEGAARLNGARVRAVEAYGKHLVYRVDDDVLHVHLGLFGKFRGWRLPAPAPRPNVRLALTGPDREVQLVGPMVCELVDEDAIAALLGRLGPDPLRPDSDPDRAFAALRATRRPIGAALLDQAVLAGLGNVYRAELLHLAGVWPGLPSSALPRERFDQLWADAARLLEVGVRLGRIVTVPQSLSGVAPSRAGRGDRHLVYGRRSCRVCGGAVARPVIAGRVCFACPVCQPVAET